MEKTDEIQEKPIDTSGDNEKKPVTIDETEAKPVSETDSDFDKLLEESLVNIKELAVGDKVEGEIINITDSYIFVSLGGKRDAYAEKQDYLEKSGKLRYKIGDILTGFVVRCSETETLISKSVISANIEVLHDAFEGKIPVNGKVKSLTKGGYIIDISGVKAFCPISQIDSKLVVDPKQFIGESIDFQIIKFEEKGKNIVVSRRVILDQERNKLKIDTLNKLEVGINVSGKVTRLTNFGAFVDLGGIEALLHISQFSWVRIDSPSEVMNIGDEIKAKIIKIQGEKISLSLKALQENPLNIALKELKEGDIVNCRILRNLPFGSFVEIKPGVEGLIPISELARGRRINNPSEVVTEGEFIEAQILKINPDKRKISLSLKALQPDPWDNIDDVISENDVFSGVIENVASFGAFIRIEDGVTGLLPSSKLKIVGKKLDKTNIGEEFKVRVVKIDKDARRISLEPTDMPESAVEDKDDWHKYKKQKSKKTIIDEDSPFANL